MNNIVFKHKNIRFRCDKRNFIDVAPLFQLYDKRFSKLENLSVFRYTVDAFIMSGVCVSSEQLYDMPQRTGPQYMHPALAIVLCNWIGGPALKLIPRIQELKPIITAIPAYRAEAVVDTTPLVVPPAINTNSTQAVATDTIRAAVRTELRSILTDIVASLVDNAATYIPPPKPKKISTKPRVTPAKFVLVSPLTIPNSDTEAHLEWNRGFIAWLAAKFNANHQDIRSNLYALFAQYLGISLDVIRTAYLRYLREVVSSWKFLAKANAYSSMSTITMLADIGLLPALNAALIAFTENGTRLVPRATPPSLPDRPVVDGAKATKTDVTPRAHRMGMPLLPFERYGKTDEDRIACMDLYRFEPLPDEMKETYDTLIRSIGLDPALFYFQGAPADIMPERTQDTSLPPLAVADDVDTVVTSDIKTASQLTADDMLSPGTVMQEFDRNTDKLVTSAGSVSQTTGEPFIDRA